MDSTPAVTHLGLCAGYGGIELGLKRAIPSLRTISLCEIEAFAISNLVAKMEAGLMDPAPIWPDLKTFPWAAFRDRVDILTGGYPCQPFSAAGKRLGGEDPRHLWPHISRGISILQPRVCFFENVEGHITCGLHHVLCDLGRLGYRTTWGIFSASECGAPHQRKRVFIMAVASGFRGATGLSGPFPRHEGQSGEPDDGGGQAAWPSRPGEQQYGWEPPRVVGDTESEQDRGLQQARLRADAAPAGPELGGTGCERQEERQVEAGGSEQSDEVRDMADTISGWGQQAGSECGSGEVAADSGCKEGTGDQQAVIPDDQGGNAAERQTQPPLGGDADGSTGGLDYAELSDADSAMREDDAWTINGAMADTEHNRKDGTTGEMEAEECPNEGRKPKPWDSPQTTWDKSSGGGYAELSITCDNRTDELRLLGNGVVPATAERAFRSLMQELDIDHPVS